MPNDDGNSGRHCVILVQSPDKLQCFWNVCLKFDPMEPEQTEFKYSPYVYAACCQKGAILDVGPRDTIGCMGWKLQWIYSKSSLNVLLQEIDTVSLVCFQHSWNGVKQLWMLICSFHTWRDTPARRHHPSSADRSSHMTAMHILPGCFFTFICHSFSVYVCVIYSALYCKPKNTGRHI